jgi:polyhydroxybutyrate depolymerase
MRIRAALAVVAAAATVAVGATSGLASTADASAEVASAGCGQAPPASGTRTVTVDGVSRSYILDVPARYDRSTAAPIVFGLHGLRGTAGGFRTYAGLGAAMGAETVLVYPSATGSIRAWNNDADTRFFDAMLDEVSGLLCVDRSRVFAVGHSMGGIFANHLGCVRGDVLRGVAPVAGAGPDERVRCVGSVAVWLAHGDPDNTVSFPQGEASRDFWVARNGCSSRTTPVGRGVEHVGCAPGSEVRWFAHDEGHSFPGWAADEINSFFTSRK